MEIKGTTKLLGVIGHPIAHSLSPIMHNAAIAALGVDSVYLPLPIAPQDFAVGIAGLAAIGLQGFSITIPHKQAIIPFLAEVSDIAQAVGAVNTVWRTDQGWQGTNTDVQGFLAPLHHYEWDWSQRVAVVLGAGGAARAVVAGCAQLGCAAVQVVGRNPQKLEAFRQSWEKSPLAVNLTVHAWDTLSSLLPHADLLVNSTPIGMHPYGKESPLENAMLPHLRSHTIAYDLIYTPRPTPFLRQAQQQGAIAIDGIEMLVHQGAAALEIWLQQPAPIEVMRQALLHHLEAKH